MSIRTLIEINHDQLHKLDDEFLDALRRYVCSASREAADDLQTWYGVRVLGMRHHSSNYILDGEPDGFPVSYLPRAHNARIGGGER